MGINSDSFRPGDFGIQQPPTFGGTEAPSTRESPATATAANPTATATALLEDLTLTHEDESGLSETPQLDRPMREAPTLEGSHTSMGRLEELANKIESSRIAYGDAVFKLSHWYGNTGHKKVRQEESKALLDGVADLINQRSGAIGGEEGQRLTRIFGQISKELSPEDIHSALKSAIVDPAACKAVQKLAQQAILKEATTTRAIMSKQATFNASTSALAAVGQLAQGNVTGALASSGTAGARHAVIKGVKSSAADRQGAALGLDAEESLQAGGKLKEDLSRFRSTVSDMANKQFPSGKEGKVSKEAKALCRSIDSVMIQPEKHIASLNPEESNTYFGLESSEAKLEYLLTRAIASHVENKDLGNAQSMASNIMTGLHGAPPAADLAKSIEEFAPKIAAYRSLSGSYWTKSSMIRDTPGMIVNGTTDYHDMLESLSKDLKVKNPNDTVANIAERQPPKLNFRNAENVSAENFSIGDIGAQAAQVKESRENNGNILFKFGLWLMSPGAKKRRATTAAQVVDRSLQMVATEKFGQLTGTARTEDLRSIANALYDVHKEVKLGDLFTKIDQIPNEEIRQELSTILENKVMKEGRQEVELIKGVKQDEVIGMAVAAGGLSIVSGAKAFIRNRIAQAKKDDALERIGVALNRQLERNPAMSESALNGLAANIGEVGQRVVKSLTAVPIKDSVKKEIGERVNKLVRNPGAFVKALSTEDRAAYFAITTEKAQFDFLLEKSLTNLFDKPVSRLSSFDALTGSREPKVSDHPSDFREKIINLVKGTETDAKHGESVGLAGLSKQIEGVRAGVMAFKSTYDASTFTGVTNHLSKLSATEGQAKGLEALRGQLKGTKAAADIAGSHNVMLGLIG